MYCRYKSRFRHIQLESPLELDWGPVWAPFWGPFGIQMAPTWLPELSRRLQDDPGSLQDASYTPPGPPQDLPRRLQDRPQRAQGAPKALQEPPRRLREPPRSLQELSRRGFGDPKPPPRALQRSLPAMQPLASGLQVASAGCAKRLQI